jgi:hypothetical protein
MSPSLSKDEIQKILVAVLQSSDVAAYFVGSVSGLRQRSQNLSDVDILLTLQDASLEARVQALLSARELSMKLNNSYKDELFDVFLMTKDAADMHFSCLPILAGRPPSPTDRLLGTYSKFVPIELSQAVRSRLYLARSSYFLNECFTHLPESDTSKAKKASKLLLRTLGSIICGCSSPELLPVNEYRLMLLNNFYDVGRLFYETTRVDINWDSFQNALEGKRIDDWPAWMTAQYKVLRKLYGVNLRPKLTDEEFFFYDSISRVLQDLLCLDLKNIISTPDNDHLRVKIDRYVNQTASVIVKLALSGVDALADFEQSDTPQTVFKSYLLIEAYLKGERLCDLDCVAASMTLLEYSLEEGIKYVDLQYR